MSLSPLFIYLIGINIITFIVRGVDKAKAGRNKRRISEKHLLLLCALGGVFGALIGMRIFRHKTIKPSFTPKVWLITIVRLGVLLYMQSYA